MTQTRPTRRHSRRRAAWATAAFAAATVLGTPAMASASSSETKGSDETTTETTAPATSAAGCALPVATDDSPSADETTSEDGGTKDGGTKDGGTKDGGTKDGGTSGDGSASGDGSTPTDGSTSGGESGGGGKGPLTWAPPKLTSPTTIRVTSKARNIKLSKSKDYILDLPDDAALKGGLTVYGGHNVVVIGGEIDASGGRAMYLQQQTGTIHVEGVHVTGNDVHEGINVAQNNASSTVQLENIKIDQVNGSYSTHHADLLQVWAGPSDLRVDGFEGSSTYQGFFFQPTKFGKAPDLYDLRNVVLRDAGGRSAYLLWQSGQFPIKTQDVTVVRNPKKPWPAQVMWPKNGKVWADVANGAKSTASPLTGDPGTGYKSPGYRSPGVTGAPPKD